MTEQKLRANIRKLLFEDHWVEFATDDKAAGKFDIDTSEEPIDPVSHTSTQISVALPPVDDEDYVPTTSVELSRALEALFKSTPENQIEYVYRQAHRLRSYAEEKSKSFRVADPSIDDTIPLAKPVRKSTKIPKKVKNTGE